MIFSSFPVNLKSGAISPYFMILGVGTKAIKTSGLCLKSLTAVFHYSLVTLPLLYCTGDRISKLARLLSCLFKESITVYASIKGVLIYEADIKELPNLDFYYAYSSSTFAYWCFT